MSPLRRNAQPLLALASAALLALAGAARAQTTDISNEPLAQPASSVKPNVMLILDDSGSMEQQYTPDYLGRRFGGSNPLCFDGKDDDGTITTDLDNCEPGDPPLMTPDINTQYYNPEIRYFPALNYDGTSMPSMTSANTAGWTKVPTDGVSSGTSTYENDTLDMVKDTGTTVAVADLVDNYPDRVWCTSTADTATDTTKCKTNSAYSYPDFNYGYGKDSSGNIKYVYGAPYYYRLNVTEYCTDLTFTTCTASTVPTGTYIYPARVRYCYDSSLYNCDAKRQGSYTYPAFDGTVNNGTGSPGAVATGQITITNPQPDSAAGEITAIYVNGNNIIGGALNFSAGFSASSAASTIATAINNFTSSPNYTATVSSNVVTISYAGSPSLSAQPNGWPVQVSFGPTTVTAPTATVTVNRVYNNNNSISSLRASYSGTTVNLISSTVTCSGCDTTGVASALASAINAGGSGYTATASGSVVTITAPAGTANGTSLNASSSKLSLSLTNFAGGMIDGDVDLATTSFSGGADVVPSGSPGRYNVGDFSRVSIVPYQDPPTNSIPSTFTKYPDRTDCAGTACTYAEEMTNFANWYSYYRSRMQMAKTAIGRAFAGLSDSFRVGFITINPTADLANRYLNIDDFTSGSGGQRDLWYTKLYEQSSHGGTPLRQALSRVGRYYANVQPDGMDPSPIQLACQPNFAILTTDGYWNGSTGGIKIDGTSVGNQDNVDSGYSLRKEARYDGGLSGSTNTLADTALYYYKTDLRPDLADEVPPSTREPNAPFQHMTTYTVGLGLAGQLTYTSNYESGGDPDFERLKIDPASGGLDWPVPVADTETTLDDLWHAAVNGRGTFFSVKDPNELAQSIAETLNSVSARIGAGAAAATSNLQPVAGDNFAFTAQYETVTWIGDLKARTIDLSTGFVAFRQLWSAADLLDQRSFTDRHIYTFDAGDTTADPTATPPTNGNKLKSFCWPGAIGLSSYPTCDDGSGLTSTEMDYFLPLATSPSPSDEPALVQSTTWSSDGSGRDTSATAEKVVDYLRGDSSNEMTGGSAVTDLFRSRNSLLGDIVSAQPAYVKASPFSYTDAYYSDFKNTTNGVTATRKGTVFAASNDGMLHAFETDPDNNPYFQTAGISTAVTSDDTFTGTLDTSPTSGEGSERWAYIPGLVLPHLKRLADSPYTHRYFTDGSPIVGDVCFGETTSSPCASASAWHTILVAGLNSGGRGYYALDVTDPDNPKGLWELKGGEGTTCLTDAQADSGTFGEDCNIGLTYGNPLIVKRASDGKWVVIVTSGYNNVNPGDGIGYLYEIDAQTGLILKRLSTGVGCDGVSTTSPCVSGTADPSGLGRINAWVDDATHDNTALTVYGGDLKGNLWRFQLQNTTPVPVDSVTRIATLNDGTNPQPITTRPELGLVGGQRVIFVGTGKFLGTSDKTDVQRQSFYAIKDDMTSTTSPTVDMTRTSVFPNSAITGFVRQDLVASSTSPTTERTTTTNSVDFTDPNVKGWFLDFPDGGSGGNGSERVNVDPVLQFGTLVVPSNVPNTDSCSAGGYGWVNFLDYKTGGFIQGSTENMASTLVSSSLIVGVNVVQLPGGTVKTIVTTADNQQLTKDTPVTATGFAGRRVSWRELFFQ